ncbi:MAG: hypothetical protein JSR73_07455 [Proteobacteria bacterium]|nr:hypothetical protein [Pseudomonadota bacterium]
MKHALIALTLIVAAAPAARAGDVAVSVSIGEPGFYGQIDIGNIPRPPVLYAQPILVERAPEYRAVEPIYLRVPPGYAKHWSKHCREYNACGRPVYFVREDWYQNDYAPRYHREHGLDHDHRRDWDHDRGKHRGERHEDDDHDRDHGRH